MEPLDLLIAEAIRDNVQKLRKLRASGSSVAEGETATHDIELLVGLLERGVIRNSTMVANTLREVVGMEVDLGLPGHKILGILTQLRGVAMPR